MGRSPTSNSYITPYKADGTRQVESAVQYGRGAFTLSANTTYYFILGAPDCPWVSAGVEWDESIVLTTMTIEDTNHHKDEASDYSTAAWTPEKPTTAYVGTNGASGVTVSNGVVTATGGAVGNCMFHVADSAARRTRLAVVVGATGGEMRVAAWSKE